MKFADKIQRITGPYSQYKRDIFSKLGIDFEGGKKLLDIGCGGGSDAKIFRDIFHLDVEACDVYKHEDIDKLGISFKPGSVLELPYEDSSFDYVFLHDVLHHVDEENQSKDQHRKALKDASRVVKLDGMLIILEGNRYNPLFYPHMVKLRGHDHFKQSYFVSLVKEVFPKAEFKFFEAHVYPKKLLGLFKIYEWVMEKLSPSFFLSYNAAFIKKEIANG